MTIIAICGKIGSGKSLKQLDYGLEQCNKKLKRLVTNFALNKKELRKFASMKKYGWLSHIIDTNQIACIDASNNIEELLIYPNSVVLLDEAGIFLNSREFGKTSKKLLMDLAQSRKFGCDLIYAAQFDEQVDKQMRMLTQYFIHAAGVTSYCQKMRRPALQWKTYWHFDADAYFQWSSNSRKRGSFFRTWFDSFKLEQGFLTAADMQLFNCFDSFARLDMQSQNELKIDMQYIEHSYFDALKDNYRASLQRDTKTYLGGAIVIHPSFVSRPKRAMLPYEYDIPTSTLTVRYVSYSAKKAGFAIAEPLPSYSLPDFSNTSQSLSFV